MDDSELDRILKALADPTRRRIVDRLLAHPDQTLFEICATAVAEDGSTLTRQAISQHLGVLEAAGLVRTHWKGRTKIHALDIDPLAAATEDLLRRYIRQET